MQADTVVLQLTWRGLRRAVLVTLLLLLVLLFVAPLRAQKSQEDFRDAFNISENQVGTVSIATSSDGRYVYVAGRKGVIVSDDHGRTGSWSQTVKLK